LDGAGCYVGKYRNRSLLAADPGYQGTYLSRWVGPTLGGASPTYTASSAFSLEFALSSTDLYSLTHKSSVHREYSIQKATNLDERRDRDGGR
jgi:hypothetical protein